MLKDDQNTDRIEAIIQEQIRAILAEQSRNIPKLSAKDKLSDTLGLSSLDLATLISELELALDADPFAELIPVTSIRTVGDLVRAYQMALQPDGSARNGQEFSSAVARARLRRTRRKR